MITKLFLSFWDVLGDMSPFLIFGFFVAGIFSIILSSRWIEKHLGGTGIWPIVKSALLGIPIPLCSCGVIPVTASIRKHGAGKGATISFLLSTPQTGVDSIFVTYSLLGPIFAVFRPLVAFLMGIGGGLLIEWFDKKIPQEKPISTQNLSEPHLHEGIECTENEFRHHAEDDQADEEEDRHELQIGIFDKFKQAMWYGFYTLPRDLAFTLLLGIFVAALISTFVHENAFRDYLGGGIGSMFIMMLIGMPLYVCSTSSIPVALGFMHLGASPGAILVFLITGPATNAASILLVLHMLGRRLTVIYLLTIVFGSLVAGLSLDKIFAGLQVKGYSAEALCHTCSLENVFLTNIFSITLLLLFVFAIFYKQKRAVFSRSNDMEKGIRIKISGMSCNHCVTNVTRALKTISGVKNVIVDLETGEGEISGEKIEIKRLVEAVNELGYKCEPITTNNVP
ncbi:MAG: SO_0444 family Cu/Zn efflux transporter [Candidatus Riflebacteria bacterium]|nr:SO_0444 family Cu/Zn efflux transporter [Candidatus Riflebacteria bacterium]